MAKGPVIPAFQTQDIEVQDLLRFNMVNCFIIFVVMTRKAINSLIEE